MQLITSTGLAIAWVKRCSAAGRVARPALDRRRSSGRSRRRSGRRRCAAAASRRPIARARAGRAPGTGGSAIGSPVSCGRLPDGVVDRVVERPPVDRRVRPHEHRHHARAARRRGGSRRRPPATSSGSCIGGTAPAPKSRPSPSCEVVGAPVVVRAGLRLAEVDVVHALEPEHHRRVQHREVDAVRCPCPGGAALAFHAAGRVSRVADLAVERARSVLVARRPRACRRQAVRRHPVAVVDEPLLAVGVGLDVPDPVAVLRGRVLRHPRRVLEDVPVGVDVAQVRSSVVAMRAPSCGHRFQNATQPGRHGRRVRHRVGVRAQLPRTGDPYRT